MMGCDEVKNLFSNYIENDIDNKEKKLMEGHLAICANCAKELQNLKEIVSGLKKLPEVEPPPYFLEAVRARMEEPSALAKFLRRLFVPVYIKVPIQAVTVTAAVIIIMFLVQKGEMGRLGQPEMPLSPQRAIQEAYSPQIITTEKIEAESRLAKSAALEKAGSRSAKIHRREILSQVAGADLQNMSQEQSQASYLQSKSAIIEKRITVKTKDLEQDLPKLNKILLDLGITGTQTKNYADKVLFNFQIPANKLELLLSKLKEWQIASFPSGEEAIESEVAPASISVALTITSQGAP